MARVVRLRRCASWEARIFSGKSLPELVRERSRASHAIDGMAGRDADVQAKGHLAFFRGYLSDLIDAVKKASAGGATLAEMQTKIGDQLAPKYEAGFSKYPLGRYRDRVGTNVESVYTKVVKKA